MAITPDVVIGKVAKLLPAGTVTLVGTWALGLLDESERETP